LEVKESTGVASDFNAMHYSSLMIVSALLVLTLVAHEINNAHFFVHFGHNKYES